jgi:GalNAc-alpha-(1->4)-GalNAc-alpha-(1->3)-diNAcBac-PP-undecaprenol alpha-1,4-N-acetyl-D-galactosaminyltransferase
MKIDFLINSLTGGGAERVMTTLANGFSHKSFKVKLITFNKNNAYQIDKNVSRIKLHQGKIKNHSIRSLINLIKFYKNQENRPDILISFMPITNFIAIMVSKFYGIKIIISEHNNHEANKSFKSKWIRLLFYKYADATTVLTSFDVPFYESLGAKVTIMPNPIILPKQIREYHFRNKNILVAGSLKRFKVKGFDSLLYLIAPILKSNPEWTLTIAGSGESGMLELKEIVQELKLTEKVIFTGFCENIQELMQNSQIYVLSSQYEGLPMVLMEALSNGMACVAYDCVSGPSDLIEKFKNGLLIKNQNSKSMQEGIKSLLNEENLRARLALNAPASVNKYSLDNILNQWELLIDRVLNNGY